jgi:cation diffusion facilitator family transporter
MSASGGTKAIVAALIANSGIAVSKFVAFVFTGSSSMLAEAVHSVADSTNQALLLMGGKRAQREATPLHPFGFGRERYFWSFVVAIVLFTAGAVFAIYEGIAKIRDPHEIDSATWAIGVLVVAIGLETFSLRTAVVETNHARGSMPLREFVRTTKVPELPVVLLEDIGALVGLVLALGGVGLTLATDEPVWDGIGTLSIGVLLGIIAVFLAIEMKSLLIGEAASKENEETIARAAEGTPGVRRVIHLRTQHLGPEEVLVGMKLEFDPGLTMAQLASTVDATEAAVRAAVPTVRHLYLEPDLFQASESAPAEA